MGKLVRRVVAIMCIFMMVISMTSYVAAVETSAQNIGKVTVTNAKAGETYNIYKILTLESYDKDKGTYSYKRNGDAWDGFINTNGARKYIKTNNDGYVSFRDDQNNEIGARNFGLLSIEYAKNNKIPPTASAKASNETNAKVVFDHLPLGYYVVETSAGTACSIDTTRPEVEIRDKHASPSVSKLIANGGTISNNKKRNSMNRGDNVFFETIINVKPHVTNYVLHDYMDKNLLYNSVLKDGIAYYSNEKNESLKRKSLKKFEDYNSTTETGDGCNFHVTFTESFYKKYQADIDSGKLTQIYIKYLAAVKNDAPIDTPLVNTSYLTYGNNSKTEESKTETFTYRIPVFKYTGYNKALAGAKFILSKNPNPTEDNALKFIQSGSNYDYNKKGNVTLVSYSNGMININGLQADTYYLKEIEAPKGYNLMKTPIKIIVTSDVDGKGVVKVDDKVVDQVQVLNNTGSLLPSTGGMGTTLIYAIGSILVLSSGIILFIKRRKK